MSERVLVITPHCNDETLGLGGTLAQYARFGGSASPEYPVTMRHRLNYKDMAFNELSSIEYYNFRQQCRVNLNDRIGQRMMN